MDKWQGKVMTIREVCNYGFYKMEEDKDEYSGNRKPGWDWYKDMIQGLYDENLI